VANCVHELLALRSPELKWALSFMKPLEPDQKSNRDSLAADYRATRLCIGSQHSTSSAK